ncbi:MAG: excinuclease ABC subunit UvrC [DPANN group archaeon]|nr:excinuclease ABC subunit UvrC [DPANN group archaeon]
MDFEKLISSNINDIHLKDFLEELPTDPGVYLMKNEKNEIIYIGKAKNLKKRIKSYFIISKTQHIKVETMVSHIKYVDFIATNSEVEALILESELVKKYKPKYNILLKDDKGFPYIAITMNEQYPRILVTRRLTSKKNLYFGPYTQSIINTVTVLRQIFKIRNCNYKNFKKNKRPCLSYDINNCEAPCQDKITQKEYLNNIDNLIMLLSGKDDFVIKTLEETMKKYSKSHEFEKAKVLRDRIIKIKKLLEKQVIVSDKTHNQDVIGVFGDNAGTLINMIFVRNGAITGKRSYMFSSDKLNYIQNESKLISEFIKQYYNTHDRYIPKEILLPSEIDDNELIAEWLSKKTNNKINLKYPKRGKLKALIEIANKNANLMYIQSEEKSIRNIEILNKLKSILKMDKVPRTIEAFDISTLLGKDSVASCVRFKNGVPDKSNYRKFKIKTVEEQNDFAMMNEVIKRRYKRIIDENKKMPNLILIDGGKGQLKFAIDALKSIGIQNQPIISLAKREEEIHIPWRSEPIKLEQKSEILHLLMYIRDESHRFALSYHKTLRKKSFIKKQ